MSRDKPLETGRTYILTTGNRRVSGTSPQAYSIAVFSWWIQLYQNHEFEGYFFSGEISSERLAAAPVFRLNIRINGKPANSSLSFPRRWSKQQSVGYVSFPSVSSLLSSTFRFSFPTDSRCIKSGQFGAKPCTRRR